MINPQPKIFVIGTASLDILHFAGQTVQTVGGAGVYTALAARRCDISVGLFAPRPDPMPESLQPIADKIMWIGPTISPEELPRLEIEHHGGGRATLISASWGGESELKPDSIPTPVQEAEIVHIAALSSTQRQFNFWQSLQTSKKSPRISVGTYAKLVYQEGSQVRSLFEKAALFFMNENEANGLFGSVEKATTHPKALLFVTLGEAGAWVIDHQHKTFIASHPASELDPTGAGDSFCGATLAGLVQGLSPSQAAQKAVKIAAQTIQAPGPAALLLTNLKSE